MSDNSESDGEIQLIIKSSKKTKRYLSESDEEILDETGDLKKTPENKTGALKQRSSERLKKKSQRKYCLPDRKETLDKIAVKDIRYEDRSLRPRKLTNNFVKGLNRYVTDRIETFESEGSELSDFIDDSDIIVHTKNVRKRKHTEKDSGDFDKNKTKCKVVKKTKQLSSDDEISSEEDDNNFVINTRLRKRTNTKINQSSSDDGMELKKERLHDEKRNSKQSKGMKDRQISAPKKATCEGVRNFKQKNIKYSSGEDSSIQEELIRKVNKKQKYRLVISDDDKTTSSENEKDENIELHNSSGCFSKQLLNNIEQFEQNRKVPKRLKSAKKQQREKVLAKLTAKRKREKMKVNEISNKNVTSLAKSQDISVDVSEENEATDDISEETQDNLNSTEDFIEDESDHEFVVEDDHCDDELNGVNEFVNHLHNLDVRSKENKSSSFQRICLPDESDESDNENIVSSITLDVCKEIKINNFDKVTSILQMNPSIVHEFAPKRRTLLHYAAMSGSIEITKLLLHSGADKFAVDSYFLQPIAYAIFTGHVPCLKLLLENTDLKELNDAYRSNFKFTFLHFVVYGKKCFPDLKCEMTTDAILMQCLQTLFDHDKILLLKLMNEKDSQGVPPIVAAMIAGNFKCVEYLLSNGATVDDFRTKNDGNLLHFAVEYFSDSENLQGSSCLKLLLRTSLKDKINNGDSSGFTPLMYAAQGGNHDCVLALLEAGASVLCKDWHGTTSLHLAAASGDTQSVKLLLQYGHKVDCLDSSGWPPLLYANFAAHESCVLSLMEPNPKQIFVLGDLLKRGTSEAGKERNFKVVKDVIVALANQDAYYRLFNDFIRSNPDFLDEYDRGLLHKTWRALLDYDNKLRWFKCKLNNLRNGFCRDGFCESIRLEVDREAVFDSAMKKLNRYNGSYLRNCRLDVTFKNEEGMYTGPKREFFVNICKDIVDEHHKIFHLTDDNQYSFHPNAYFAEMAKIQGGPINNEKSSSDSSSESTKNNETSLTVQSRDSALSLEGICGSSGTLEGSTQSSITAVPSHDVDSSISTVPSLPLSQHRTCSDVVSPEVLDNVASNEQPSVTIDTIVSENHRTSFEYMDETEDRIIAELNIDEMNHSGNLTRNFVSDQQLNDIVTQVNSIMDERDDAIIAEMDTSEINFYSKHTEAKTKENPPITEEMKKLEFSTYVEEKLAKNISQLNFLGRIIGTAICEGFFINLNLCKTLVKQIVGIELNHPDDLGSFDYKLHKNLVTFILESDNVEDLELPCTLDVLNPWNKHLTTLTLFSDETKNEELLTDENKVEYVNLVSQYKLTKLVKKEMDALCQGLYEVIPKSLFSLFNADEFSLLINGITKIDVDDWRNNTVYNPHDAASTCKEIEWFWKVVSELKENEKALLLKFSTGSPCLPAGGFAKLQGLGDTVKFHISMKSECNKIPTASTCFNLLKLPKYESMKDLKDKLLIAIRHGTEGFSFS